MLGEHQFALHFEGLATTHCGVSDIRVNSTYCAIRTLQNYARRFDLMQKSAS